MSSKCLEATTSTELNAVFLNFGFGGWQVIPVVIISATPAVSPVLKRDPTLNALRTLSNTKHTGLIVFLKNIPSSL